ncbi:unnamed protein product [Clonostachys solani]|uniref:Protein kinase domain-containing protein n=1 Tax=Clonostachys solani TaxID=160281 RepID=A0A9P0EPU5_9HYPO|nr:unnamed protein product [Clonostachys solani]
MDLKASQRALDNLKYYVSLCRDAVNDVRDHYELTPNVTVHGTVEEIASYTLKLINQFSFIVDTDIRPTWTHYNRLVCLVTELYSTLGRSDKKTTAKELRDILKDWTYKFDRYWFLFAIYVDDPTSLIRCLPDHTSNDQPTTHARPLDGYNAIRNSTLQLYSQHRGTDIIIDGHGLVVNHEDPPLSNRFPEGSGLFNRLRNAAALSSSLMNAIDVLPVGHQTPTPLVFETEMKVKNCDTLRTALWKQQLVIPVENAEFAYGLAEAVHGLHVCNVQHGSIMPDCVLVASATKPLLHGFLCDPSADWGWNTSDGTCNFNGYYHMDRRGERTMKKDIRNLGICLLELGSTNSFLKKQDESPQRGVLWTVDPANDSLLRPSELSTEGLLGLVDSELDDLGHRFSEVVRACLTVSDLHLGEQTFDEKVDLSIWFIDHVLFELRKVDVNYEEMPLQYE